MRVGNCTFCSCDYYDEKEGEPGKGSLVAAMYEEKSEVVLSGIAAEMESLVEQVSVSEVSYEKQIEVIKKVKREFETFVSMKFKK